MLFLASLESVGSAGQLAANFVSSFSNGSALSTLSWFQAQAAGAFLLNLLDYFIIRDLLPFSEILNMSGIPVASH